MLISVHKAYKAQDSYVALPRCLCQALLSGQRYVWHGRAAPKPSWSQWMRGWTQAKGGKQRKYTHHRIKGEQDRRVGEKWRWRKGGGWRVAVMRSLFWLVWLTKPWPGQHSLVTVTKQRERERGGRSVWGLGAFLHSSLSLHVPLGSYSDCQWIAHSHHPETF